MKTQTGFTFAELLVTVVIMSVLVAMAIPRYTLSVEKTRSAEGVQTLTALLNAQKLYFLDNDVYADNISRLDVEIPPSGIFDPPIVENDANRLAEVTRSTGAYRLSINEDGALNCDDLGENICSAMGYQ